MSSSARLAAGDNVVLHDVKLHKYEYIAATVTLSRVTQHFWGLYQVDLVLKHSFLHN